MLQIFFFTQIMIFFLIGIILKCDTFVSLKRLYIISQIVEIAAYASK